VLKLYTQQLIFWIRLVRIRVRSFVFQLSGRRIVQKMLERLLYITIAPFLCGQLHCLWPLSHQSAQLS